MSTGQANSRIATVLGFLVLFASTVGTPGNVLFAEPPREMQSNRKIVLFSARVIRGPEAEMQEFVKTLPLSPIPGFARDIGFQQAVLSKEQVTAAVNWTEKHKSVSLVTIPQVTFLDGQRGEIEFVKGRTAEIPVPQNGIRPVSIQQKTEGIKLRLNSSRDAGHSLLKCEWELREFISLQKFTIADPDGKKRISNLPGPMKAVRFQMAATVPDGDSLAVSGFTWNGGTKKTEALLLLLEVAPVDNR